MNSKIKIWGSIIIFFCLLSIFEIYKKNTDYIDKTIYFNILGFQNSKEDLATKNIKLESKLNDTNYIVSNKEQDKEYKYKLDNYIYSPYVFVSNNIDVFEENEDGYISINIEDMCTKYLKERKDKDNKSFKIYIPSDKESIEKITKYITYMLNNFNEFEENEFNEYYIQAKKIVDKFEKKDISEVFIQQNDEGLYICPEYLIGNKKINSFFKNYTCCITSKTIYEKYNLYAKTQKDLDLFKDNMKNNSSFEENYKLRRKDFYINYIDNLYIHPKELILEGSE